MLNTISDCVSEELVEYFADVLTSEHWITEQLILNDSDRENQSWLTKNETFAIPQIGYSTKFTTYQNGWVQRGWTRTKSF